MVKTRQVIFKRFLSAALGMFLVFPGNLGINSTDKTNSGQMLLQPSSRSEGVSAYAGFYEDEQVSLLIENGYLDDMASAMVKVKELTEKQAEKANEEKVLAEKAVLDKAAAEKAAAEKAAAEKAAAEKAAAEREAARKAAAEKAAAKKAAQLKAAQKAASGSKSSGGASYSDDELMLVARLIQAEAGGGDEGQLAVASVLYNRVKSSKYPNTVTANIRRKGQFSVASDWEAFLSRSYSARALANAKAVFLNGQTTLPKSVMYFRSASADTAWGSRVFYAQIGGNFFYE